MVVETAFIADGFPIDLNPAGVIDECVEDGLFQTVFDSDVLSKVAWFFKTDIKRLWIADPLGD